MAGRILNRRELRKQTDAAPPAEQAAPKKAARAKAPAEAKPRKPSRKKAPERLCARWGVFDGAMKQVAVFDFNQRAAAEEKVAALSAKKAGSYFLQIVKVPMPEPAAG
jgi:hypothetical protein